MNTQTDAALAHSSSEQGLSLDELWIAAGEAVFARALPYAQSIRILERTPGHAVATSTRTTPYLVEIWWGTSGVQGRCSCPHNGLGNFCKHMCALGLMVLFKGDCALIPPNYAHRPSPAHSSAPGQEALDALTPEEERYLLRLVSDEKIIAEDLHAYAALKDLSNPKDRYAQMHAVRQLFSGRYLSETPIPFLACVNELLERCRAMIVFGNAACAYQLLDLALRRFSIILGSSQTSFAYELAKNSFADMLKVHSEAAGAASHAAQLACALVTLRDAKSEDVHLSFLPYAQALGQDGMNAVHFHLAALKERLEDPQVAVDFFASVHADEPLIRKRQAHELELMQVELAYMLQDDQRVEQWAHKRPDLLRLPVLVALAHRQGRYQDIPPLVESLRRAGLVKQSGARSITDPRLFTQYSIHPKWALRLLGDNGFTEEAVECAFRLLQAKPGKSAALRWKKTIDRYSATPESDYAKLMPWLLSHAHELHARARRILIAVDDAHALWEWDQEVGLGQNWEALVFAPLSNRGCAADKRQHPESLSWSPELAQHGLQRAGARVISAVKAHQGQWDRLHETLNRMRELAQAADADLGVTTHSAWLKAFQQRIWTLQTTAFQPATTPQKPQRRIPNWARN